MVHGVELLRSPGAQEVRERARRRRELGPRAVLDEPAPVEDGDVVGPGGRGQPVGDEQARPAGEELLGGGGDAVLGDGVHPRRRLVEDDDAHVAHEQPGERDELLLPRRQGAAAGAEAGRQPVGQAVDPVPQAQGLHG